MRVKINVIYRTELTTELDMDPALDFSEMRALIERQLHDGAIDPMTMRQGWEDYKVVDLHDVR